MEFNLSFVWFCHIASLPYSIYFTLCLILEPSKKKEKRRSTLIFHFTSSTSYSINHIRLDRNVGYVWESCMAIDLQFFIHHFWHQHLKNFEWKHLTLAFSNRENCNYFAQLSGKYSSWFVLLCFFGRKWWKYFLIGFSQDSRCCFKIEKFWNWFFCWFENFWNKI
jgi:hypothetical protein